MAKKKKKPARKRTPRPQSATPVVITKEQRRRLAQLTRKAKAMAAQSRALTERMLTDFEREERAWEKLDARA